MRTLFRTILTHIPLVLCNSTPVQGKISTVLYGPKNVLEQCFSASDTSGREPAPDYEVHASNINCMPFHFELYLQVFFRDCSTEGTDIVFS